MRCAYAGTAPEPPRRRCRRTRSGAHALQHARDERMTRSFSAARERAPDQAARMRSDPPNAPPP
jgi:hypothetical protein